MFKNHPIGLYTLALTNTCERFGHYTMLAVFTLFLQVKFGLTASYTATILGVFLGVVYFTPLLGGIIADKWWGYRKTIKIGIFIMFSGYFLLAFCIKFLSQDVLYVVFLALLTISIGIGFFKGNLQVLVGNLYDASEQQNQRDNAFSIYYMALNIGTLFAPTVAEKITNFVLVKSGLFYNAKIPALTHQFLDGTIDIQGKAELIKLAAMQQIGITDLTSFSRFYISKLSESYDYVFWMACLIHIALMLIYLFFRKTYEPVDCHPQQLIFNSEKKTEVLPTQQQIKERIIALIQVYFIVIFFWMSFDQNWLTLTFFARDYTAQLVTGLNRIEFDVISLSLIALAIYSLFGIFQCKGKRVKWVPVGILMVSITLIFIKYYCIPPAIKIYPELFQQFNPFFVIALTPVFVYLFCYLAKKKKEPSAPCKIGIGMMIASLGYIILAIGSVGLATPIELKSLGGVSNQLVSPNWLIVTYLTLTAAELLLSPIGISLVSKIAPPQYKGMMMGGWFVSTAIGGYLVSLIGYLWNNMQLWKVWGILVICCLISALYTFSIMKRLEKISK
ncbi:MAG: peptide MFS transporter [Candidatus Azobacteroides pseudotrichonymphae]|jgi:POT family proton-dependent oligopeptide transporter|uniref:H+/peptide symporter n=1 Tax=Azobacteroides pseudotrichonymphae genomovar. CFP2 TaxID=511995 RepID=B6YQP0_AZOPC|nr:MFS transporter [Candidatus Azobacteroides pseudotrichonymphae]BAG83512.1 putative H+/peptide symporter [Candidatus Azobacteroides pseudotrichonymphae genomovar. CFP2]GMO32836.1 MAG: peptide MFS transporter [Candidatus Azobacteroides pseudotrichonymphae]